MTNSLSKQMENLNSEEPKFEKWNELPPELKLETIKKLDFKTRCNLRSTCHLDKSLVDSQKFHIDKVDLYSNSTRQRTHYEHRSPEKCKWSNSGVEMIPAFEYVLEHGIIKELLVEISDDKLLDITDKLRPIPWSVKCMKLRCSEQKDFNFCLDRLNEKVEIIKINASLIENFSFDSILTIPQIIKVPFLEINVMKQPDLQNVYKLAQTWIKNDASIGQRFDIDRFAFGEFKILNAFKEEFLTRIVRMETADGKSLGTGNRSDKPENLRIRTDNPSKHILIQTVDLENVESDYEETLHMIVIPADMKETEYDMKWYEEFKKNSGIGSIDLDYLLNAFNNVNLDEFAHLLNGVAGAEDFADAYEDYYDEW